MTTEQEDRIKELELRQKASDILLEKLQADAKRKTLELESREWHFENKPKFDWRPILLMLAMNSGIILFMWYWLFNHKGLH